MMLRVGDAVRCPRFGPGTYQIVEMDERHFLLEDDKGHRERFYKGHCHIPSVKEFTENRRAQYLSRIQEAQQIGRVVHPKRK